MKPTLVLLLLLIAPAAILSQDTSGSAHLNSAGPFKRSQDMSGHAQYDLLSCSPAPCVLPNVLITANQSDNTILAANPRKPRQLLAGLDSDFGESCPFGSVDGGSSWYADQNSRCAGNSPSLAYGGGGTAYQVGENYDNPIEIVWTTDNGNSWSGSTNAVPALFASGTVLTPWIVVDNSSKSPYRRSLYVAATQINFGGVESEVTVSFSRDGGVTWVMRTIDPIQAEPSVDHYTRIAVASDGTVYVAWQRCEMRGQHVNCGGTKAEMWISKSIDGGKSWSAPTKIVRVTLVPDSCGCAFYGNLPHTTTAVANAPLIAVDNSDGSYAGSVYVVVYNWTGKQMQLELLTSRDGGKTWGSPTLVAGAARHDEFFPGLSISDTGVVGVSWLDRRNDPYDVFYQPFAAISTDGGMSFGTNYQLAKPFSNPFYGYMGDYTGNAWAGKTLFFTWPDSRNQAMQDYVGGLLTQ